MPSFFYLLNVHEKAVEVRRIDSLKLLSPILESLHRGETLSVPALEDYPRHVRQAVEKLDQVGDGWMVVPGEGPKEPSLSRDDQEFLKGLSVERQAPDTTSFFEKTVEQMREFLPQTKKNDPEVERIALIVLTECVTRGLFLAELHSTSTESTPEIEPVSPPKVGQGMRLGLEIGKGLEARFKESWQFIEDSLDRTLDVDYGEFVSATMSFVSDICPIPYAYHAEEEEISVYIDGTLRGGVQIPPSIDNRNSLAGCLESLVRSLLADTFRPDVAARHLETLRKNWPHAVATLEAAGWNIGSFYRLFNAILARGLGLCRFLLADVMAHLCALSEEPSAEELEAIVERAQFFRNCPFGYGATSLKAVELSADSIGKLQEANRIQDIVELEQLRLNRRQHREIVLVPPALCKKARLLFGLWGVATSSAIPADFEIHITGKL